MQSKADTVDAYLKSLPADRRADIERVRKVVLEHLPEGYEEGMQYGMIGWYIPLEEFPNTYNGQPLGIAALASQKGHMSLYMMGLYSEPNGDKWFKDAWKKTGKKLDMGKSCLRFNKADDLALDLIGQAIARIPPKKFMALHDAAHGANLGKKVRAAGAAKKSRNAKKARLRS